MRPMAARCRAIAASNASTTRPRGGHAQGKGTPRGHARAHECNEGQLMTVPCKTPLLDRVRHPADLRNLSTEQLKQLAAELRAETIDAVSVTGGHLGASLGVVELTVALHSVFDTPHDRLIWAVGNQAHPHNSTRARR